jgi:predicted nucleotidyltransferase component of viral defense system
MLTYDTLIEQAELRNMPVGKIRGILREYLHILILKQVYRTDAGRKLYFTGGTYLRLVHDLKRFSEDLDINSNHISQKDFEELCHCLVIELKRSGIAGEVTYSHWDHVLVCRFNFPDIEKSYGIRTKHTRGSGLLIKLEVNIPTWKIESEIEVITGYGETYPCVCTKKGILFADKIDALVKKRMGRHLYDIIFMLSQKFPVDNRVFKKLNYKVQPFNVLSECVNDFSGIELKNQTNILRPFFFDEQDTDLILNAKTVIAKLIQKYS